MKLTLPSGHEMQYDTEDDALVRAHPIYLARGERVLYARMRMPGNKDVKVHRLVMGDPPRGLDVDHIDHNGLNNRKSNLRVTTRAENCANQRVSKDNTSGYKGVHYDRRRGKWVTRVCRQYRRFNVGLFDTAREAAEAYNAKAKELFGVHACLNEIKPRIKLELKLRVTVE